MAPHRAMETQRFCPCTEKIRCAQVLRVARECARKRDIAQNVMSTRAAIDACDENPRGALPDTNMAQQSFAVAARRCARRVVADAIEALRPTITMRRRHAAMQRKRSIPPCERDKSG